MSWTTPRTWAAGETVTAAMMNTHVRDNLNAIFGRKGGRARTNATQALSSGVTTDLNNGGAAAWTSAEDTGGYVSASVGTTTPLQIPAGGAGNYIVGLHVNTSAATTTRATAQVNINSGVGLARRFPFATDVLVDGSTVVPLSVGDTIGLTMIVAPSMNALVGCEVYAWLINL